MDPKNKPVSVYEQVVYFKNSSNYPLISDKTIIKESFDLSSFNDQDYAVKKILIINWRDIKNPEAGGAEIYLHEIFKRLAVKEFSITIISHHYHRAPYLETIDGLTVIRRGGKFFFNFQIVPFLIRHYKEYDLIIEDLNKLPFFTPFFCRIPRLHLVMHFFGREIFKEAIFPIALYVFIMEKLVSLFYRKERFTAISKSTAEDIARFPVPNEHIYIIEPGIDIQYFYPVCSKVIPPIIVYIGRLMKYKNVQFIISCLPDLLTHIPELTFYIGGTGDYLNTLKKHAVTCRVQDHIHFLGCISEEQKRELLSKATLFINPSAKEGWGITNIEANLCGTVSLSNNVNGLRDSVIDGITGILYQPENRDDFISKAVLLLTDDSRRASMEKAAIKRAQTLDWDTIATRMESIL